MSQRSFAPGAGKTRIIHNPSDFNELQYQKSALEALYAGNNFSKSNLTQAMRQLQLQRHLQANNDSS